MAQVTDLGFTVAELIATQGVGDVRMQKHPEFPNLTIWNYTEEAQFRNRWNKITLACRGLIIDLSTEEIVARPWEKFFNLGQMDNRIHSLAPVEVTDKLDGSLGILYWDGTKMAIATRGSFASEQAIHATKLLNEKYQDFCNHMILEPYCDEYTVLFEIIYPDNRIVVNYGDTDDLVLLGAVNKKRGEYIGPGQATGMFLWDGPVTEVWQYDHFVDAISAPDRKGKEGYCIRSGSNIVKLKQADYVELHRIVTNLSPKTIWEMLGSGKTTSDICSQIPDEFHDYVVNIANELIMSSSRIQFECRIMFDKINFDLNQRYGDKWGRKEFAGIATQRGGYSKFLFLMLDGKPIHEVVWQEVKPRGDIKSLVKDDG